MVTRYCIMCLDQCKYNYNSLVLKLLIRGYIMQPLLSYVNYYGAHGMKHFIKLLFNTLFVSIGFISDFLYERKNDVLESPYFSKIYDFGQDVDKFYKDIMKNDIITNIRKYSNILYSFIREKYFTMVPFGKDTY